MGAAKRWVAGGAGPKATLMALMGYMGKHDGEWTCFPGDALLAAETEQHPGTVARHLAAFTDAKLLSRRRRGHSNGGRATNEWVLNVAVLLAGNRAPCAPADEGVTAHGAGGNRANEGGVTAQTADPHVLPEALGSKTPSDAGASPPPKTGARISPEAREMVTAWMDERKAAGNAVGQPFIACAQVVHTMLGNGVKRSRVEWALRNSPVCSTAALDFAIQRRLQEAIGNGRQRPTTGDHVNIAARVRAQLLEEERASE